MTEAAFTAAFRREGLSVPVRWVDETGSTNDDARAWGREGAPHGATVVAGAQTSGRGRLQRAWISQSGIGLWMTVVLRPELPVSRLGWVSLAAGAALAEAVGEGVGLKWPNDLLALDGRKVAGILAEREPDGGFLALGIGVNLRGAPSGLPAACLAELGIEAEPAALAARFVRRLLGLLRELEADTAPARRAWEARSLTFGRRVRVGEIEGVAIGLAEDGGLRVDTGAGVEIVRAGDVAMVG